VRGLKFLSLGSSRNKIFQKIAKSETASTRTAEGLWNIRPLRFDLPVNGGKRLIFLSFPPMYVDLDAVLV
jgi:hypothetical protein